MQQQQFENMLFYSKASNVIDVGFVDGSDYSYYWFYVNKSGSSEQIGFETSVHYTAEPFNITASHSFVDSLSSTNRENEVQFPAIAQDGAHLLNASVMYSPLKELDLSLSVKNILGENNLSPMIIYNSGIAGAPAFESTTFWLNVRVNFDGNLTK
jgi:hypothetical protein